MTARHDQPVPLEPRLATGPWRVDPARSHASFAARVAGCHVRGTLPLAGRAVIAEPIEASSARLTARTRAVSTGVPALDRLLAGPGFLDARSFPEITFATELLAWVPGGWRAVGRLQVKGREHELACQLGLDGPYAPHGPIGRHATSGPRGGQDPHGQRNPHGQQDVRGWQEPLADERPPSDRPRNDPPALIITSRWVIDSRWVTSGPVLGLSRRIVMACSFALEPGA